MDLTSKSKAELSEQLISLAASLKEEDLANPETFGIVSQLLSILDPPPDEMPKDLADQLKAIPDAKERLMQAAQAVGAKDQESIHRLVEGMTKQGLLKSDCGIDEICQSYFDHLEDLHKGAAPKLGEGVGQAYHNNAHSSANVMFRVKIKGQDKLTDTIPLHSTLKTFDKPEHLPLEEIKQVASNLKIKRPDPKKLSFRTSVFTSPRNGQQYYMLHMHGVDPEYEKFSEHFRGKGITHDKFMSHVTIDKGLYDRINNEGLHPHEVEFSPLMIEHGANNPTHIFEDDQSKNDHLRSFVPKLPKQPPQASENISELKMKKSAKDLVTDAKALLAKIELEKGMDEHGNPIKGSNKRFQQAKVFGKPSDTTVHVDGKKAKASDPQAAASAARAEGKKAVLSSKIPDANGERTSPQRMKMMNTIKDYAEKKTGHKMVVAEGKRDESGKLKTKVGIDKEPFDVFSSKGHKEEKSRQANINTHNESLKPGQKPMKRVDPKPDHRSGNLETQPSPDAAVHEIAHEALAPKGMNMAQHQTHMDVKWGESQSKYGHMQQKKTAGEIQPMAAENPLRREMGLPANRTTQKVKDATKPVEQTVDGTGPRFNRGKDKKGHSVDLMRQSRLLSPEHKERINQLRDGRLKYSKDGITEGTSPDAKINARAAAAEKKPKAPPQATEGVNHIGTQKPTKLAASELGREVNGTSYRKMQKSEKK